MPEVRWIGMLDAGVNWASFTMQLRKSGAERGVVVSCVLHGYEWDTELRSVFSAKDSFNTNLDRNHVISWTRKTATPTIGLFEIHDASCGLASLEKGGGLIRIQIASLCEKREYLDVAPNGYLKIR